MLVLTRKPQEKIRIGDGITITVIKTKGKGVRLGIEAPADVPVLRGELIAAADSFAEDAPPESEQEGVVSFARVSRSAAQAASSNLVDASGPLREMLNRRAASAV